ncbi:MAG: DUF4411 family protein [Yaniella sp.]|uniref:DUF4411 family protein n=1 Tax=Yaniella sp. TaxID=2773929 RepID=UPI0026493A37|nr:DUF4411 family protein [Yaniella sp.]MDN5818947.1 DUF4411 family protein [Yaniella sp.]MDN6499968.1 DUF4411 family protein [Yaniella sp.]
MKYLLDANIFITAKNLHYGFGFVPAFWDWLDRSHENVLVWSTRRVRQELSAGNPLTDSYGHDGTSAELS